jgi:predicted signal transduction protein with EAL and GGDEF domain
MHKNGTVRDSAPVPIPLTMGVPSLGGTFTTAGGVAFLSGTLDQSFVRNLDSTSGDGVIVRSTIEMSHNLGLKVVAEGVEFAPSLKLLKQWNCDTAQGYLISRPLNAMAFEMWMRRERVPL